MDERAWSERIHELVSAAHAERRRSAAIGCLESALQACITWHKEDGCVSALTHQAEVQAQIAIEQDAAGKRSYTWDLAFAVLEPASKSDAQAADVYASLAVDCFQDLLSDLDLRHRQQILRRARDRLDAALASVGGGAPSSVLLCRKSSVLRHLSQSDVTEDARLQRLDEARRCAALGVQRERNPFTVLELGLAEWACARHESTDEQYSLRLRAAERQLTDRLLADNEVGQMALARFYRLTFQAAKACETYAAVVANVKNLRRVLRDAYVYGEAAAQLWFAEYPDEVTRRHLSGARALLEGSVAAGYRNARVIVGLAYLAAMQDGAEAGETVLGEICARGGVQWDRAIEFAAGRQQSSLLELGFALGVGQAAVWTRLGTFATRFLQDEPLAEGLYRGAIKLDPHDAIALTNLARFLVKQGDEESNREARRLLQKAQAFSDRRFTWWRSVLAELEHGQAIPPPRPSKSGTGSGRGSTAKGPAGFTDLTAIRRDFRRVEALEDTQQRGYELERLVYEMARLTFGTAAPAYRIERAGGGLSQIDGYFEHGADRYRVECKWQQTSADHDDVAIFAGKLDVVGIGGLLISMAGFTDAAVGRAKELRNARAILLMDGEEVRALFDLQQNFDDVVARKRLHFDQRSEPYHRVIPATVAA